MLILKIIGISWIIVTVIFLTSIFYEFGIKYWKEILGKTKFEYNKSERMFLMVFSMLVFVTVCYGYYLLLTLSKNTFYWIIK